MKSIKPNPFDWRAKPSTLFTRQEKASMKIFAVTKNTERKELKTYSRAGAK